MEITLPVRLTEEDVAASAGEFLGVSVLKITKPVIALRIIYILFCIFIALYIIFWGLVSVRYGDGISFKTAILSILIFIINAALCMYLMFFYKIEKKSIIKRYLGNFRKDFNSQMLHTFVISAEGISAESRTANSILHWEDIYHLTEFASCFTIEISSSKRIIFPRRCFENAQHLRDFRSIVSSNMPPAQWTLKGIPLGLSKPDAKSDESLDDAIPFPDQKDCLYSIKFQIEEKEDIAFNFCMLQFSNHSKALVVEYAFVFGLMIWAFFDDPLTLGILILICLFFLFWQFLKYRNAFLKSIKTDKTFGREEIVSFYSDRVVIQSRDGQAEYFWNTVVRIRRRRAGLLIYLHPGLALIFPARVINSMPNKEQFKSFLSSRDIAGSKRKTKC